MNTQQHNERNWTRRDLLTTGATGLAAAAAALATTQSGAAAANTLHPPQPAPGRANPNGRFAGKVVLITGATYGIGETAARAFAHEGAIVHFCGRNEALGRKVEQSIGEAGGVASYQRADVTVPADVQALAQECVRLTSASTSPSTTRATSWTPMRVVFCCVCSRKFRRCSSRVAARS